MHQSSGSCWRKLPSTARAQRHREPGNGESGSCRAARQSYQLLVWQWTREGEHNSQTRVWKGPKMQCLLSENASHFLGSSYSTGIQELGSFSWIIGWNHQLVFVSVEGHAPGCLSLPVPLKKNTCRSPSLVGRVGDTAEKGAKVESFPFLPSHFSPDTFTVAQLLWLLFLPSSNSQGQNPSLSNTSLLHGLFHTRPHSRCCKMITAVLVGTASNLSSAT